MSLTPGTCLGPYEVTGQIGAGGMGEVYRARDTQLGRDVALKVLPDLFVSDPDRVARFQREAKTLAALNHPNIGGIHGLQSSNGMTALVLELVEGPTLADRIAQGPIPMDEALRIAQQIGEALEAAHEQGIVHRDLKPANIKLRPDDTVKVLDFGLAKSDRAETQRDARRDLSQSPTVTTPAATSIGVIMGTAAYMSPEQARGKALDKRTDIWAFGCVFYEMLAGRRAFIGDDVSEVIASILAREPDWSALPATTPVSIRRLLRRCLAKDRNERLRDIGDARIEIREAIAQGDSEDQDEIASSRRAARWTALAVATSLVIGVLAVVVVATSLMRREPGAREVRLEISTPSSPSPDSLAISPDGRTIAFTALDRGILRIWLRALDSADGRPLRGTEGAHGLFWSPNSRSIGFFADNKLKRIDLDSGSVRPLTDVYRGTGGAWNGDGVILFTSLGEPISRIGADGGTPELLKGLFQEGSNFAPEFLPDGRHFLYYVRGTPEARGVYVGALDGSLSPRRLFDADQTGAVYASSGHLLFVRQRVLFAQAFDASRRELSGEPFPVAQHEGGCTCIGLSVSETGSIAYRVTSGVVRREMVWFDRAGKALGTVGKNVAMSLPSLSPDGTRVIGYRGNVVDGNVDIWMLDVRLGIPTRLTTNVADDVGPAWAPDGQSIAFVSNRNNATHDIYRRPASAGGNEELLLGSTDEKTVADWSRDGRYLLYDSRALARRTDVWALPLDGSRKPFPVANSGYEELRAQFSPDGQWVAYQSDEAGQHEIYVQTFPNPGQKWRITSTGGTQVRWAPNGKELFYLALDGRLMQVSITLSTGKAPEVGTPVPLFTPELGGQIQIADFRHAYDVSPDGQRFLVSTGERLAVVPITVIVNWKPR